MSIRVPSTKLARRGCSSERIEAGASGLDDRQGPGGSFYYLHRKGTESCDSSRYSALWHVANAWAENTACNPSDGTFGDHQGEHGFACVGIAVADVGQADLVTGPLARGVPHNARSPMVFYVLLLARLREGCTITGGD